MKLNMDRIEKWSSLFKKTNGLSTPSSIDKLLLPEEIYILEKTIIKVLNGFFDKGETHAGIKIYVEKELRNDFIDVMASNRPQENETLEEWGIKIFGDDKFGVIFNSLESYDNEIGEIMCSIVEPLLKQAGLPLGGLSFLFFMGNYGFTPFGIHKEAIGEEGFLFHLGPGEKEFYTWDTEELNEIEHNTMVFHEVEEMLPASKKYILKPSSVMFIPHQVYHIGNTNEFSLSVVMDYINPSKEFLEQELAKEVSKGDIILNKNKNYLKPIRDENNNHELIDPESISKKFSYALDKRILQLKSNGGLLNPSNINNKIRLPNGEFSFKGKAIFPIFSLDAGNGKLLMLARGNEIVVKYNENLTVILARLNEGELLTLQTLRDYFLPEWDLVEVYSFVSDLIEFEAIDLV
jgi:hypothetical protein